MCRGRGVYGSDPDWWIPGSRQQNKSATQQGPSVTAGLFIENFLQGRGKDITASILPQVEYFVETAQNCSARMSFVGKSDSPAEVACQQQRQIVDRRTTQIFQPATVFHFVLLIQCGLFRVVLTFHETYFHDRFL